MLNKITVIGNVGTEPEMKYTPNGNPVTSLRLVPALRWKVLYFPSQKSSALIAHSSGTLAMSKTSHLAFFFAIAVLLIAACGDTEPAPSPTSAPELSVARMAKPTQTATPTATPTAIPIPTQIPMPTSTPTPASTREPSPTSTAMSMPTPRLTHGGLVGAITDTSVNIWGRTDREAILRLEYRLDVQASTWTSSPGINLTIDQDFTGVVSLTNLTPNTTYSYRLMVNDVVQSGSQATFDTLKPEGLPSTFSFAIGADTAFHQAPFSIFEEISEKNPAFMILMGDQIYADQPISISDSKAAYELKYKENWAESFMKTFMKQYPIFMIWDDHEIDDDWDSGKAGRYLSARAAYDEYQGNHNPAPRAPGQLYYSFRVGEADFYVLDTRSFRSPNDMDDGDEKTMLGQAQKADLQDWLSASTSKVKFIVSSVPWHDLATTGNDAWQGFTTERQEIFDFIRNNCIEGVVLLSGDQHWAGLFRLSHGTPFPYHFFEFSPTPLGHINRGRPDDHPQALFLHDGGKVFGVITVDTTVEMPTITFEVYDEFGEPVDLVLNDDLSEAFRITIDDIHGQIPSCGSQID